ncbi:NEDD1 protein [Nymphaea thermarum]|nr:NEDD1 protein [Nymphaea thermarum]
MRGERGRKSCLVFEKGGKEEGGGVFRQAGAVAMAGGQTLVAASAGDTVKIFDTAVDCGDPCTLQYSPSPGFSVNSVKWNHTNLVVASAGDDKKISLWRKNGQSLGTIQPSTSDIGDNIDESILSISFSNKSSRYVCTGGSAGVVRIWDLQRKRCIKWLRGHTGSITGAAYTCKDEHLASISVKGDLILHNLVAGARTAELKDPNGQVLRVLDYSRTSRHLLVTAGDDGSILLWDTNGRNRKASWLKQHSAPTTGVCFSPTNDKIIATCGLDKKIYTFDASSKRVSSVASFEAPFSSLAFKDDGRILAAGTNGGSIVFYDVRGKLQPVNLLRAYNSSEAVTSVCWQRSKPVLVNESNCTMESALLGDCGEDSVLMPDPRPSSSAPASATAVGLRNSGRSASGSDTSSLPINSGVTMSASHPSTVEETPVRTRLGGALPWLQAVRTEYNLKDDMEVFSPLVDVQPITPSLSSWHDDRDDAKIDYLLNDKKSSFLLPSASSKRHAYSEGGEDIHSVLDVKSDASYRQEDTSQSTVTPLATLHSDQSHSATPPEDWGADGLSDMVSYRHRRSELASLNTLPTGSSAPGGKLPSNVQGLQDPASVNLPSAGSNPNASFPAFQSQGKDISSRETASFPSEIPSSGVSTVPTAGPNLSKMVLGQANYELHNSLSLNLSRKNSYLERIIASRSSSAGATPTVGSPKLKKTGTETREELVNSLFSEATSTAGSIPTTASATTVGNISTTSNAVVCALAPWVWHALACAREMTSMEFSCGVLAIAALA